jgi:hypothetical protein
MASHRWKCNPIGACFAVALLALVLSPSAAPAQGFGGYTAVNSKDGYLDSAIPGDQFRLRFDAGFGNRRPSRAEFFYAKGAPLGPGLPRPEPEVDYQDFTACLETTFTERLSGFVETPWRFLNPEVNANAQGFGDMNLGFKYAFLSDPCRVAAVQLRTYLPTGAASRGLGTHHVSLEPALLVRRQLDDRLCLAGELRCWIPVGGTDFAGEILRYGLGLQYNLFQTESLLLTPVAEFVGWTVLSGKVAAVQPPLPVTVRGAAGDTVVSVKLGVHLQLGDRADVYTGYGQPLTGDRWYDGLYRLELRLFF